MSEQDIKDCNLIVVAVVEGYAYKHNISVNQVLTLFNKYDVLGLLRSQYNVLHMLDLDEATEFAEDIIKGKVA